MSLINYAGEVWLNGKFVAWQDATVSVLSHTLHYGAGVFEGLRAYETEEGTAIFRLIDHTERLFRSAKIINMVLPFSKAILNEAQQTLLQRNQLRSAYLRPLVFYGPEYLGVSTEHSSVQVMIAAWRWGAYVGEDNIKKGIKVITSSYCRNPINSLLSKAKACGNYLNSILALQDAKAQGNDEVLLLDQQGFVAEGSAANFFIVRDGELLTPHATTILEGITRDTVMQLARDQGLVVKEKSITRDEVYIAEEAFFTGSGMEITPIREVDNRLIGGGQIGPITAKLQVLYHAVVRGEVAEYRHWLTVI